MSEDPNDLEALTPSNLLLLRKGDNAVPGTYEKLDIYKKRWNHVQFLADTFWERWRKEYLQSLCLRKKWIKYRKS